MKTKRNNRPKSKNNPNGKPKDVRVDGQVHNARRKAEGTRRNEWMPRIADKARELLGWEKACATGASRPSWPP